jgi:hypothetical protein
MSNQKKMIKEKIILDSSGGLYAIDDEQRVTIRQIQAAFCEPILRFLPREIQDYPSHGIDHTNTIIRLTNVFLKKWSIKLSKDERFIIYLAAWTHDLGRICGGSHHNEESEKIIDEYIAPWLKPNISACLKKVAVSHSHDYDIDDIPETWNEIRLKLICSIFRIIDAAEIDSGKSPKIVYDLIRKKSSHPLNPMSNNYWLAHLNIQVVGFDFPEIVIGVEKKGGSELLITKLKDEIESVKHVLSKNHITIPTVREDPTSLKKINGIISLK